MGWIEKLKAILRRSNLQVRDEDITALKSGFLQLHDYYERNRQDLSMAQKCSYYALNVSKNSKSSEIIFFCHELATMYAENMKNFDKAILFFKMGLDYVKLTRYDDQKSDLVYFTSLVGKSYYFKNEYKNALEYYLKAKALIEKTGKGKEDLDTILSSIESIREKIEN
jgi:tetratricopeptide (TPR) repeat protein